MRPELMLVHLTPTDGVKQTAALAAGETVSLCGVAITLTAADGLLGLTLAADAPVRLHEIALELLLPEDLCTAETCFYADALYTNDPTGVFPWQAGRNTRTLFLLHQGEREWGIGQVTALRFYAELVTGVRSVSQVTDMEDKALVPGETYTLEKLLLCGQDEDAEAFAARWVDTAAACMGALPRQTLPVGWCSWSCLYNEPNAEKLRLAIEGTAEALAGKEKNLIQIDDGWQQGESFPGKYVVDEKKFPEGLEPIADLAREKGMDFGLWVSPLLITESSPFYEELRPMVREDLDNLMADGKPHPFDLADPAFDAYLTQQFAAMTRRYGVRYYKIDFLASAILFVEHHQMLRYDGEYRVALLRRAFASIRAGVGPDVTLLACGAPMLECLGYFNAARVSHDITVGGWEYWPIIQKVVRTVLHRGIYNKKAFLNDPDGLVVRDYDIGDGFDPTYAEVKTWATALALSGGSVFVNEEMQKISPRRMELFRQLVPPLGISARPVDRFEMPTPSRAVIDVNEDVHFAGAFHWGDDWVDTAVPTADFGFEKALAVRCWDKTVLGVTDTLRVKSRPHSAELYLLRRVPDAPCFLFADVNVFGGVGCVDAVPENGTWRITESDAVKELHAAVYGWVPTGCTAPGEVVQTFPEGTVVRIR